MNNKFYEHRQLIKSFYATYSVGFFTIFLISLMMIYSSVILEILQITKQELAFAVNVYVIFIGIAIFGFLTSNMMPIIIRQSIKMSSRPIPTTISHVTSLGQSGFVFGPAIVGYSAEVNGLTFNVYAFCIIFFITSIILLILMSKKMVGVEGIEPTPPK